MSESPKEIIISADFGGTKGDLIVLDAETGAFLKRIQESIHTIPRELFPQGPISRGIGRTPQMGNYCLEKALDGLSPAKVHLIYSGMTYDKALFDAHGVRELDIVNSSEADGIMDAEQCRTGICSILGTGAISKIYQEGKPPFLVDASGPICGDWGSGFYIGFTFVRSVLRKQNFTHGDLWETTRILDCLEEQMQKAGYPRKWEAATPISIKIAMIFLARYDRSFVASLARLCDECARKGSAIAREVLVNAANEVARELKDGAAFTGIDKLEQIPVITSGSIFLHSDIFYEAFCRDLTALLPNAAIRKSTFPQTYGHAIRMLEELHGREKAVEKIERFKREVAARL